MANKIKVHQVLFQIPLYFPDSNPGVKIYALSSEAKFLHDPFVVRGGHDHFWCISSVPIWLVLTMGYLLISNFNSNILNFPNPTTLYKLF